MSDLTAAINRLADAVEALTRITAAAQAPPPADEPCARCAGKGSWAPGVPCNACGGSGKAPSA